MKNTKYGTSSVCLKQFSEDNCGQRGGGARGTAYTHQVPICKSPSISLVWLHAFIQMSSSRLAYSNCQPRLYGGGGTGGGGL